ncbi:MAG: carbohydrate porin [Ignavibacteria bacterium]
MESRRKEATTRSLPVAAFRRASLYLLGVATCLMVSIAEADAAPAENETPALEAHFQTTYVWQRKPAFAARYSGENSLVTAREPRSYTLTATGYVGGRPWDGGEIWFNPEAVSSQSLSGLHGLGGFTNGENEKGGGPNPTAYRARLFMRHTWSMGGGTDDVAPAPNRLGGSADRNRVVLTAGNLSVTDIFDANAYSHDPRTQFLNWTIMTSGAYDFAADTRGYTWGAAVEWYQGVWAVRAGRFEQPIDSNGFALDSRIFRHYGDQLELEHSHEIGGRPGKLRLLAFRNHARMGSFQEALDAWRAGGSIGVPSVAVVRRDQAKLGFGVNAEQALGAEVGVFFRASRNDGRTESYAFTEVERSVSGGIEIKGGAWQRPDDAVGFAFVQNGLASAHRAYLAAGGLGAFIGDGPPPPGTSFRYANEQIVEAYYSLQLAKGLSASLDWQRARNPAYNADRGPVSFVGARLHFEY